jgi:hypothetical protein
MRLQKPRSEEAKKRRIRGGKPPSTPERPSPRQHLDISAPSAPKPSKRFAVPLSFSPPLCVSSAPPRLRGGRPSSNPEPLHAIFEVRR